VRREPVDALAGKLDRALDHFAALGAQNARDGLERGGLAGAVAAEQRRDPGFRGLDRDSLQHQDHAVIDDLDVVET